jgi:fatty acid desaturase
MPSTTSTPPIPRAAPPLRANIALASGLLGAHALALLIAPGLQLSTRWQGTALVAIALLSPMLWALVHEAIHGLLFASPRANRAVGRLLAIAFGAPFRALRFAHLRHHRYSRTPWGREEVYDPAAQPRWLAYAFHYLRITIGLYVAELAMLFACWLPAAFLRRHLGGQSPDLPDGSAGMQRMLDRDVLGDAPLREIRIDALAVLALYGASFALYGAHWPWLVAVLGVRALIASQLDHAPHHGTPLDRREYALNMQAPAWLQLYLLNFPLHRVHHAYPHLPWTALPKVTNAASGADISFFVAVLRQWRGPIALDEARKIVVADAPGG